MIKENDLQTLIYTFIKIAYNKEPVEAIVSCDWYALLELAAKEGVKGVVWQGIEIQKNAGRVVMDLDSMLEWWGQSRNTEAETKEMYEKSVEYAEKLLPYKCVVLKGIDYSRYWSNPLNREFGDLDHWSGEEFDAINAKAKEIGAKVSDGGYKHNHVSYDGLTVENHRYFTEFKGTKQGKETEKLLRDIIGDTFRPINGTALLSPNENFTAIFMLRHAQLHFLDEGMSLRQVLDWQFFLSAEQNNVNWDIVIPAMKKMGMMRFASALTQMCVKRTGLNIEKFCLDKFENSYISESLLDKLENDIIGDQPDIYDMRLHKKAIRIFRRFKRMWVFRELLNESYFYKVWQSLVYNTITGIQPGID